MKKPSGKKKLALLTACLIATASLFGAVAQANFADDWTSNMTTNSTNGSYYKGAQRGYMTGGSFSSRWKQSSDSLVTISKPSVKSGCGGVDMFLGGMSFMNADYLVEKLQRILSAAPAAAFDIALKTLAPQVSSTIKEFEAIVNKLNNLQLDDCKAAKGLVGVVGANSPISNEAMQAEFASAQADFMTSSGATDLSSSVTKLFKSEAKAGGGSSNSEKAASKSAINGCPAKIKTLFSSGSVMSNLGTERGMSEAQIASLRGYIGDVLIQDPDITGSKYKAIYNKPCDSSDFDAMVTGQADVMDATGACSASTDAKKDLIAYISTTFDKAIVAIKTKTPLAAPDLALLRAIPLPIVPALKAAAMSDNAEVIIHKLAAVSAKGLAYSMMYDLVNRMSQMEGYAKHVSSAQNGAAGGAPETCQPALFADPIQKLDELYKNAHTRIVEAREGYQTALVETQAIDGLVATLEKFSKISQQEVAKKFGRGVALRVAS